MSEAAVLNELGVICALGRGKKAVLEALLSGNASGMRADTRYSNDGKTLHTGQVDDGPLPDMGHAELRFRSRNNQLLLAALEEIRAPVQRAIEKYGAHRIAVILGTSTSGVAETEAAFFQRDGDGTFPASFHSGQMEIGSPSDFLSRELSVTGPCFTVSTACSSSAKALFSARRLLKLGICDAAVVGGADSLCRFTVGGFLALEAVSRERSLPFHAARSGINIGEAAALFLLTREGSGPKLVGWGESSDAHHISAPQPDGIGAAAAMQKALSTSGLSKEDICYLNAHGTGTLQNDLMESRAIHSVLGTAVPVSSTKPLSGHTLGAAGALEAAFCWLLLQPEATGQLPVQLGKEGTLLPNQVDPQLSAVNWVMAPTGSGQKYRAMMSNSFGFGGSNASLILSVDP